MRRRKQYVIAIIILCNILIYRAVARKCITRVELPVRHIGWQKTEQNTAMVVSCCVVGCSNRAKKGSNTSFYRIPKVITNQGEEVQAITQKR